VTPLAVATTVATAALTALEAHGVRRAAPDARHGGWVGLVEVQWKWRRAREEVNTIRLLFTLTLTIRKENSILPQRQMLSCSPFFVLILVQDVRKLRLGRITSCSPCRAPM
jgi:hypothetical protein